MSKFTPGPWSVAPKKAMYGAFGEEARKLEAVGLPTQFEGLSIGTDSGQIAIIPLDESNEANAQLIAAAPELLHCLKMARAWLINQKVKMESMPKGLSSFEELEEIITKAEGK